MYTDKIFQLNEKTGGFPRIIPSHIHHGFSWGHKAKNLSENPNFGIPEETRRYAEEFLAGLNIAPIVHACFMDVQHGEEIVVVDDDTYLLPNEADNGRRYYVCDALFTKLVNIPIIGLPGDCTMSIVYAKDKNGEEIVGLIHAGRAGLGFELPKKAMEFLIRAMECDPHSIYVGTPPSIGKKYHTVPLSDLHNKDVWENYLTLDGDLAHLDGVTLLHDQLLEAGIPEENFIIETIDNYEAASEGVSFSHRYAVTQNKQNGRFMVVVEKHATSPRSSRR